MTNEPAERLRDRLNAQWKDPTGAEAELDAALTAERRATVERIRAAVGDIPWGTTAQQISRKRVLAILDAEAQR